MSDNAKIYTHSGIWIGTMDAAHDVYDHSGIRIGTADARGDVYDHSHVRIGRVGRGPEHRPQDASYLDPVSVGVGGG